MDTVDKIYFVFAVYDFNNASMVSSDECTLLLRSVTKGMAKLHPQQGPIFLANADGDLYADLIFRSAEATDNITNKQFMQYCIAHPVISSWLLFNANIPGAATVPVPTEEDTQLRVTDLCAAITPAVYAALPVAQAESLPYVPPPPPPPVEDETAAGGEGEASEEAKAGEGVPAESAGEEKNTDAAAAGGADAVVTPAGDAAGAEEGGEEGGEEEGGEPKPEVVVEVPVNPLTPWTRLADANAPAEVPPSRSDAPEDSFELQWVFGNSASAGMRKSAAYTGSGAVVFTASRYALTMTKEGDETPVWTQRQLTEHQYPLTCMNVDAAGALVATGDRTDALSAPLNGKAPDASRIVISSASTGAVVGSISTGSAIGAGVRLLNFNYSGKLLLAVYADVRNTVCIYDTASLECIYLGELSETPLDVTFCLTDAIFATASETGVTFYVDEGNKFLPAAAFRKYERREGLLQAVGKEAGGSLNTACSRFEQPDELISGTAAGQVLFWHGRSCIQLLASHRGPVTALSYNASGKVLASAGRDGCVKLYKIAAGSAASVTARKGPRLPQVRALEVVGTFDMMLIFVPSRRIASLCLHTGGEKVLVGTASGDLLELSLVPTMPEGEGEGGDAAGAAEGGDADAAPAEGVVRMPQLGRDINGGPIVSCHWSGAAEKLPKPMVWGLCKAPGGFVSCGSDGMVCLWSSAEGAPSKLLKKVECDSGLRGVTVSASALAVTMDGSVLPSRLGTVQIFSLPDLVFITEFKTAAKIMSLVRFSPDGGTLIVGGADETIYVYAPVEGVWAEKGTITSPSGCLALDFASDGACVRVVNAKDELAVYDVSINVGAPITSLEIIKSLTWASAAFPCCWDTKGAFKRLTCVRSEEEVALQGPGLVQMLGSTDRSQHLFVSAGDAGVLFVTRVPADAEIATTFPVGQTSVPIHCGRVSSVCFIEEGTRLVTAGADDGIIQVWKVNYEMEEPEPDAPALSEEELQRQQAPLPEEEEEDEDGKKKVVVRTNYDSAEEEDAFDGPVLTRHLSVRKPVTAENDALSWMHLIDLNQDQLDVLERKTKDRLPTDELYMDWVYGYNARSTRGSVRYGKAGKIIYPAGSIVISLDKGVPDNSPMSQSYFMEHCDEISCLDVHAASGLVCSAHKGTGDIVACVWSSGDNQLLKRINLGPVLGASAIAFSPSGKFLAIACQDADHTVSIYDWRTGMLQCSYRGGAQKILSLTFSLAKFANPDTMRLLQSGYGHFKLVDIKNGRSLLVKAGYFGMGGIKMNVTCALAVPPSPEGGGMEFVLGLADGSVAPLARGDRKLGTPVPVWAGKDAILTAMTLAITREASGDMPAIYRILVGGKGYEIRMLDAELQIAADFSLAKPEFKLQEQGAVRGFKSLCVDRSGRKILYGTSAGEIGEIDFENGQDVNTGPIVTAHYKDELHAMATHPIRQELATAGDDKTLRVWDMQTKQLMGLLVLPDICRSVCWAPNGHIIICGLGGKVPGAGRPDPRDFDGKVVIVSFLQNVLNLVHIAADAGECINALAYSPDGSKVYVGSNDSNIYIYDALDNFKLWTVLRMHSEGVAKLDMSDDGKLLISTSILGDVMMWNTETLLEKAAPIVPDLGTLQHTTWYHREGTRGYNSTGIFGKYSSHSDVLALSSSKDEKLLATGDVYGALRLFANPCFKLGAPNKRYAAHSPGGVSRVSFSIGDQYLVSIGKTDRLVVQWRVGKSAAAPEVVKFAYEAKAGVTGGPRGNDTIGVFSESFVVGEANLVAGYTPSASAKSSSAKSGTGEATAAPASTPAQAPAPAAEPAEAVAVVVDVMTPPQSCWYMGAGHVAESYDVSGDLMAVQRTRPLALYGGLSSIITVCGKQVVALSGDRLEQTAWRTCGGRDECGALCLSACTRYVAVGTTCAHTAAPGSPEREAFRGCLSVLNAATGQTLSILSEAVAGGVSCAAFSHDGLLLAMVGGDERHLLSVFASCTGAWVDASLLYVGESSAFEVTCLAFLSGGARSHDFVTCGAGGLRMWTVTGRNITFESVAPSPAEAEAVAPELLCMAGIPGTGLLAVGDKAGGLTKWEGLERSVLASHAGAVSGLCPYFRLGLAVGVASGGPDGIKVTALDGSALFSFGMSGLYASLSNVGAIEKALKATGEGPFPTSISCDAVGQRMVVGLSCCALVELSIDSGSVLSLTEGQLRAKTNGMCAHPREPHTLVTAEDNKVVKVWDCSKEGRECVGLLALTHQPNGVVFINDTVLAVGICKGDSGGASGGILFLELSPGTPAGPGRTQRGLHRTLKVLSKFHNVGSGTINALAVSPNGKYLAAASDNGRVYLFGTDMSDKPLGEIVAFTGVKAMGVDFSTCSRYLRVFGPSPAGDTVIRVSYFDFEDNEDGEVANAVLHGEGVAALRVATWASCSSPAALEARGAHPAASPAVGAAPGAAPQEGHEALVTVTSVSARGSIVAAGYADGTARIFRSVFGLFFEYFFRRNFFSPLSMSSLNFL